MDPALPLNLKIGINGVTGPRCIARRARSKRKFQCDLQIFLSLMIVRTIDLGVSNSRYTIPRVPPCIKYGGLCIVDQ